MSENPYQSNGLSEQVMQPPAEQIKSRVFPPAIALIVCGALSVMGAVWGIISWSLAAAGVFPTAAQKAEQAEQMKKAFASNPELGEFFIQLQDLQGSPISLVLNIIGIALAAIVILGGIRLMSLKSYGLVLSAAIINMIPFFGCCCYGLPVGIWALVVLLSGDVKAAFRQSALHN